MEGKDREQDLSADELLGAPDCSVKMLALPELNGRTVQYRGMTKIEAQECRRRATKRGETDEALLEREWFLTGLVSPKLNLEQYDALLKKPAGLYYRILSAILTESGLTQEVAKESRKAFLSES